MHRSLFNIEAGLSYQSKIQFFSPQTPVKAKPQAGPSKTFPLPEIKNKLSSAAKEVKPSFFNILLFLT